MKYQFCKRLLQLFFINTHLFAYLHTAPSYIVWSASLMKMHPRQLPHYNSQYFQWHNQEEWQKSTSIFSRPQSETKVNLKWTFRRIPLQSCRPCTSNAPPLPSVLRWRGVTWFWQLAVHRLPPPCLVWTQTLYRQSASRVSLYTGITPQLTIPINLYVRLRLKLFQIHVFNSVHVCTSKTREKYRFYSSAKKKKQKTKK